ncbi:acetoacetate--CoA ligase [Euzebya tangerina]|uniref:acetoacetate--CoA ligase n=1 Tax=Euzebya tangerina TaxID=591198 RepID=UPI000E311178|nr:acetoacetate--CoA ligase [Euzebya tangerina]
MASNPVLWEPDPTAAQRTNLAAFMAAAPGAPTSYAELHAWSVADIDGFWSLVWDELGVVGHRGERISSGTGMPGRRFFPDARLNYAENLLAGPADEVAVISTGEGQHPRRLTRGQVRAQVGALQQALSGMGVQAGDRVCAFMPNTVETLVVMLAATGLGATWSSTSPDFGAAGVVDRFGQVEPTVLLVADGYRYNGRVHDLADKVDGIVRALPTLDHLIVVDFVGSGVAAFDSTSWSLAVHAYAALLTGTPAEPTFQQVPFDHPLFIMYSSGTTGAPKSIVHGHGGTLVKHLVEHQLNSDLRPGDVIMWFTTCGWMMWNWLVSALASRSVIVLYDGSPSHPDLARLWSVAEELGVTHFGTSPKFLAACAQAELVPREAADLSILRALMSTGAPLNPEQFDWIYGNVAADIQVASVSGGTDLIGCFAGGVPILPVRRGELQARALGMDVRAVDPAGEEVPVGTKGELVCVQPFPSMPVSFWNDPDDEKYRSAYFEEHPGVWTHGDYIEIRPEGGVIFYGRSDTTLNPGGVRIGTAEIYRAIEQIPEIEDSIVVGRQVEGDVEVVLCVVLVEGAELDEALLTRIRTDIRTTTTPRHVPAHIVQVPAVPYTISGKKVEKAVKTVIDGGTVDNADAMANPEALEAYRSLFA